MRNEYYECNESSKRHISEFHISHRQQHIILYSVQTYSPVFSLFYSRHLREGVQRRRCIWPMNGSMKRKHHCQVLLVHKSLHFGAASRQALLPLLPQSCVILSELTGNKKVHRHDDYLSHNNKRPNRGLSKQQRLSLYVVA